MKKIIISFIVFSGTIIAQVPEAAFHPMTANGAKHVSAINTQWFSHRLFWKNPPNVTYNEIYMSQDSNLIINLDPSVKVLSGFDSSIVFNSLSLEPLVMINLHTKYYWRVVEYNSFGYTAGPVWYFISQSSIYSYWDDDFSSGLSNYTLVQPSGASWSVSNTSFAGITSPELRFNNSNSFIGTSYLILNEIFDLSPSINPFGFNHSVDWQAGEFIVGLAYSLDEGITWIPFWQQIVTEDIPATQIWVNQVPNENYVKLALFCKCSEPNSIGYWYIDNLTLGTPLTVSTPPSQIQSRADSVSLKVNLNWGSGFTVNPSWGYVIQRKNGLPSSSSDYNQIAWVGPNVLSFEDSTVELDSIYTYRIQSREGPGGSFRTAWSNETTAYVPSIVSVELVSFMASIENFEVFLNWITASETNNSGFEILRSCLAGRQVAQNDNVWEKVSFVDGKGTTTEQQSYSFIDKNLSAGKYSYRLKQIDFDGSFEYSKVIEVEVKTPAEFSLSQNYPNPFNPTTNIGFRIANFGFVTLKVYDVLGNEIITLVNEERQPGVYEVEFDGSNYSSEVYFYTLTAGDFKSTKKLLLTK